MNHNEKEIRKKLTFIKAENLGKCPCCEKNVYSDQLFVEVKLIVNESEIKKVTKHLSCYNNEKANGSNE